MDDWTAKILIGLVAIFGVYLVARLATAAYFQSKAQYDRSLSHDKRENPRAGR